MRVARALAAILVFASLETPTWSAPTRQPVIDMHMHAYEGELRIPHPETGELLVENGEEHRRVCLRLMQDHHVVLGAVSVNAEVATASKVLAAWERDGGETVLKGLFFGKKGGFPPVEKVRALLESRQIDFLGEMGLQYDGRSPSDPDLQGYFSLAEELDVPVGIHTGMSAPGTPLRCCPEFRLSLGNPYLLEDVLIGFPELRIWAMHAGGQFYNEMVTMMTMYENLYVDISPYTWLETGNAELLNRFLRLAQEQDVLDRVMFGSDQMRWPEAIGTAVERVKSLDYLSEQEKAGVLYDNAARFLRIDEPTRARHHEPSLTTAQEGE